VLIQPTEAAAIEEARHSKIRRKVMGGIPSKTGATVKPIAQIVDKLSETMAPGQNEHLSGIFCQS